MITIIDYNTGNLASIKNILKKAGESSIITSDKKKIAAANKIILPGVGAFDTGMKNLANLDLIDILNKKAIEEKTPILGICLGMQLLSERSGEGTLPGLGWIKGVVRKFQFVDPIRYKVPHMGWNFIRPGKKSRLLNGLESDARFYFVHGYYLLPGDQSDILATTVYESEFTSAVEHGNIMGVQFHPEKSHKFGLNLLRNFIELY